MVAPEASNCNTQTFESDMSARVATNRLRGASAPPSGPRLTVNSPSAPSETPSFAHAARLPIGSTTTASATASEGSVASTSRGKGLHHERESSLHPTSDRPTAATPKRQKPVIFPDIFITYLFYRFLFVCPSFPAARSHRRTALTPRFRPSPKALSVNPSRPRKVPRKNRSRPGRPPLEGRPAGPCRKGGG